MLRRPMLIVLALVLATSTAPPAIAGSSRDGGITWPDGQALPAFAEARHLDAASIEGLPRDQQLLFATLEGVINRSRPRIYLAQPGDQGTFTWLQNGLNVPYTLHSSAWDLLAKYRDEVRGTVIYDPNMPDSINVASTIAGLRNGVVASPQMAEKLAAGPYHLRVLDDLRGRFTSRVDAYTWQYEHLWAQTTHRMLIGFSPDFSGYLRDYAVANRAMVFWLDPNAPDQRALFERILNDVEPYTPYLGWFPSDVAGEFSGTQIASEHGVYVLAADFFANMTVWSGTRARPTLREAPAAPRLENKIYVTFTMTDGDNLQYDQRRLRKIWSDPARGSVPINWTISPLLLDAAPSMLSYYQRTATPNDLFMAGPSGAGYINPTPWPDSTFRTYTEQTGKYMRLTGLDTVYVLNRVDGQARSLSPSEAHAYIDDVDPKGIMLNFEGYTETTLLDGSTPQSVVRAAGNPEDAKAAIAEASAKWDGKSPLFISIGLFAFNNTPADVAEVANSLGPQYSVLGADQYFDLVREAYGASG